MAGGGREEELDLLLGKLQSFGPGNGQGDPDAAKDVIVDIAELLAVDLTPAQYGMCRILKQKNTR